MDSVSVRRGIRVQGLHHRLHKLWKIGVYDKRFLKEKGSGKFDLVEERKIQPTLRMRKATSCITDFRCSKLCGCKISSDNVVMNIPVLLVTI